MPLLVLFSLKKKEMRYCIALDHDADYGGVVVVVIVFVHNVHISFNLLTRLEILKHSVF